MITVTVRAHSRVVTVRNASNKQWPEFYECNFLEQGMVSYEDVGQGKALLKKEIIDAMIPSFIGKPVIDKRHRDISPENYEKYAVGYITDIWFDVPSGWYRCKFILTDPKARESIEDGYGVSCSFKVLSVGSGGEWHAMKYDEEILEGEGEHLAIVDTPRYEECRIFANSKAAIVNKEGKVDKLMNSGDLDLLSPIKLDQYLDTLTDAGIQGILDGEFSGAVKKQATLHQGNRAKQAAAEEVGGGGGEGKKKKEAAQMENKLNAEEAFVEIDGKEVSVADIIRQNVKLNNDLEELKDPALKNADKKICDDCGEAKHEGACNDDKKNAWTKKLADDKAANDKAEADKKEAARVAAENDKKVCDKCGKKHDADCDPEDLKKLNKKDPAYFVKLNNIKEHASEVTSVLVDTLHNKVDRGADRYGSAKK